MATGARAKHKTQPQENLIEARRQTRLQAARTMHVFPASSLEPFLHRTPCPCPLPLPSAVHCSRPKPLRKRAAPPPPPPPPPPPRRAASTEKRLFVLDTNVLLHDPLALFHFQEHDIYLPLIVLEELDAHKKGTTEVARNGRQSSRYLDALISAANSTDLGGGLPLGSTGFAEATAFAIDIRKLKSGQPFVMDPSRAITAIVYMKAPDTLDSTGGP